LSPAATSWSTAATLRSESSSLKPLQHAAVGCEGGSEQPAATTRAGVERDGERTLDKTAHLPVEAADHPAKAVERRCKIENVSPPPPEDIPLSGKRARCVDSGMDKQQPAILAQRRVAQIGEQHPVARRGVHCVAHRARPSGDRARSIAACREAVLQFAAVCADRRFDTLAHHPLKHAARVGRELQLQQLLPHLLLRAAQKYGVAGKAVWTCQDAAAKVEQLVDRLRNRAAAAQIIPEIDDPVAVAEPLGDAVMQSAETLRLTVDGRYRPDPPSRAQSGEFVVCGAALHSPRSGVGFFA